MDYLPGVPAEHVNQRLMLAGGNEIGSGKLLSPESSAPQLSGVDCGLAGGGAGGLRARPAGPGNIFPLTVSAAFAIPPKKIGAERACHTTVVLPLHGDITLRAPIVTI